MRNASAPHCSMYSSGLITLPFDFDIFAPSRMINPCARNFVNGSSKSIKPAIFQHHRDEPRIQQVQHGVFIAANVRINRQPLFPCAPHQMQLVIVLSAFGIPQEIPRAIQECVGDTSVSRRPIAPHVRARNAIPFFVARQRRHPGIIRLEVCNERQRPPANPFPEQELVRTHRNR